MINHPSRNNPIIGIVRSRVGRRPHISRAEMRDILVALETAQLVALDNGWQRHREDGDHAAAWADACTDITVISVLAESDPVQARLASSNPGSIRYDQPGSMHPGLRATLMFAPPGATSESGDFDYLRRRAKRLLIVE